MNKIVILILSFFITFDVFAQEKRFVIRGKIPGMPDGLHVTLLTAETLPCTTIAKTTVKDGSFELTGVVDHPILCTLVTNNLNLLSEDEMKQEGKIRWTYTSVFVDNVEMWVETSHYDSIPGDGAISSSFKIEGGEVQKDFNEYNLLLDGGKESREKMWEFILSHPNSVVSVYLGNKIMRQAYNLTLEEVCRLEEAIVAAPRDPERYRVFRQNCLYAKQTVKNQPVVDLELRNMEGDTCHLIKIIPRGYIVLLDFWATWCGPCMKALPVIDQLAKRFPERLVVIGISCDTNLEAWKKAIGEKGIDWKQYVLTARGYEDLLKKYQIAGVPYFLILDEKGNVICNPKGEEDITREVVRLCK